MSNNTNSGSKEKQDQCHTVPKYTHIIKPLVDIFLLNKIKSFSEFLFFHQRKYITVLEYSEHLIILK